MIRMTMLMKMMNTKMKMTTIFTYQMTSTKDPMLKRAEGQVPELFSNHITKVFKKTRKTSCILMMYKNNF